MYTEDTNIWFEDKNPLKNIVAYLLQHVSSVRRWLDVGRLRQPFTNFERGLKSYCGGLIYLVLFKITKFYKIPHHIKYLNAYMKYLM